MEENHRIVYLSRQLKLGKVEKREVLSDNMYMYVRVRSNGSYINECPTNMTKADVKRTRHDHKPGLLVCCFLLAVTLNSRQVLILHTSITSILLPVIHV